MELCRKRSAVRVMQTPRVAPGSEWRKFSRMGKGSIFSILCATFVLGAAGVNLCAFPTTASPAAQSNVARQVGTIKTISGKTITLTPDAGGEVMIQVQDDAKLLRIAPGEKDLKNAAPLQLQDLQVGDRILVRGANGPDGKTLLASSVIAMKQGDIASKQAHEREEWQRHGVGGLVTNIDAATGAITISTNAVGTAKDVTVHVTKQTVLRRYALNSVKFDDAKPAPIEEVKKGDQLRARGTRNADGTELTADEVVSGSFRNIAGTINAVDSAAGTITVTDLVTKKPVTVKVTNETQVRKLQPQMAQMIAMRLKGGAPDSGGPNGAAGSARPAEGAAGGARPAQSASGGQSGGQSGSQADAPGNARGNAQGAAGGRPGAGSTGPGGGAGGRGGDMQQMLSRLPVATLTDLQKGDAVMIVTTEGAQDSAPTAITLLAGVEPILEASSKETASTLLTPWSLSSGGGDAGAPQ